MKKSAHGQRSVTDVDDADGEVVIPPIPAVLGEFASAEAWVIARR
ncbi:MAG: hypothetical protein QOG89_401, partial [Thermomicrobiales bacterium]|nr:hypothetical protein [Thermomicrobiales bacterium]